MPNNKSNPQKENNPNEKNEELKLINENLRFLLGQKLSFLTTVSNVCMSWWVSSVVFCGSILAGVWLKGTELVDSGIILPLGIVIAFFFFSFIWFGNTIINYLDELKGDISPLMDELKSPHKKLELPGKKALTELFEQEISSIKEGIKIGKWIFMLILVVWIFLFSTLQQGCWKIPEKVDKAHNHSYTPYQEALTYSLK